MNTLLTLHDPARARAYHEAGLWTDDSFYALAAAHARARPDGFALRDSARRLTWRALVARVDAYAERLAAAGVRRGDRVSLWMSNRAEAVVAFIACSRLGAVCNPSLHRNYTVAEIVGLLERIDARAVLVEEGHGADTHRADVFAAAARLTGLKLVERLPKARAEVLPQRAQAALPPPVAGADKICYLAFTSGTTGMPKGVMHADNTLLANCRDLVRVWGLGPQSIVLSLSPLSHHIAWVGLGQAVTAGAEYVVDDPPAGKDRLDWIMESGATYVLGVPTHAMDILAAQRKRGVARLGAVKVFYMAGAPIPPVVAEAFVAQGITPQNVYGMSENSSHQFTHPTDDVATITRTCGRGGRAYEVKLFAQDDPDRAVPVGTVGEIGGRGACLMLGYFSNQAATERSFNREGWFMSGDLGVLDAKGNLAIVGRSKDLIIRGGHNIYPTRIEDIAVKHPQVTKAACFGVPDERLGEKLCLAVTVQDGTGPGADDMLRHLWQGGVSKLDMPEWYVELPEFPLTASGKILKRELVAQASAGSIKPTPCRFVEPKE
ncbi:MAG: acyl--CoA ligase [Alphaproteobacteria bacterium]|nr:acyl--CoA ligase [Alphaproteobacteria bacterium]